MATEKISERQLAFLVTMVLLTTVVFWVPQLGAYLVQQDVWLTALIASVWGIMSVLAIVALARRYPGLTLIEYLPLILGKPLGKILGALYAFWFLAVCAAVIAEFSHFLNITIMPNTPLSIFMITIVALCFYAIRSGLEVWVRVGEILLVVVVLAMAAVIIMPIGSMDLGKLMPVFDHPPGLLIYTSIISGSWRCQVVFAAMLIPSLTSVRHTSRNLIISVLFIGFILAALEISAVAVFGGIPTGQKEFPLFSLSRMISIARIFDRLEVLIVVASLLGTFFKICAFLYCSTLSAAQVFGFKEYQFLLLPLSILALALAHNLYLGVPELTDFLLHTWPGYGLLSFALAIPLLLCLIALFHPLRKVKGP